VENTGSAKLAKRVLVPCERNHPRALACLVVTPWSGGMRDHLLVSRAPLACYRGSEVHNELLHDESVVFASDIKYPESDHAPVIAEF
jgi:hypothetical protein